MQGRTLIVLAVALFVMALVVGVYGMRVGKTQEAAPVISLPTVSLWRFREDYSAGQLLKADMLEQVQVAQAESGDIGDATAVQGRILAVAVTKGQRLQSSQLAAEKPLPDTLAPGFRAMAIQVDEVTAVGGHLQPGDRVDVYFHLRANRESGEQSSARLLLQRVRVLAFGSELLGVKPLTGQKGRQPQERSVVLAVPEAQAATLMLAATSGDLRLAVVGERELVAKEAQSQAQALMPAADQTASAANTASTATSTSSQLVTLAQFTPVMMQPAKAEASAAPAPAPPAAQTPPRTRTKGLTRPQGVELYLGDSKQMVNP